MSVLGRCRQPFLQVVLLLAVAVAFGCVCALPEPGHVNLAGPAPSEGGTGHDVDGAHLASCDATLSKVAQSSPVPSAPAAPVWSISLPSASSAVVGAAREVLVVVSGPPLFLLHATFRI